MESCGDRRATPRVAIFQGQDLLGWHPEPFCGLQVDVRRWLAPFHVLAANQKLKSFKNIDPTQRRDRK